MNASTSHISIGHAPSDVPLHAVDLPARPVDRPDPHGLATEWLLTNGRGSFAMGTVAGINTRRYHGLLIAATLPPLGRVSTLNAVNETVCFDDRCVELASHEFATDSADTVFHPRGFAHLRRFEKDTACRWIFHVGPLRIVKQLSLAWRRDAAELRYRIEPAVPPPAGSGVLPERVSLSLDPLLAMRDFHHLRPHPEPAMHIERQGERVLVHAPDSPPLIMVAEQAEFIERLDWWHNFLRRVETARGQDDREDLCCPGRFERTFTQVGAAVCEMVLRFGTDDPADAFAEADSRGRHLGPIVAHVRRLSGGERCGDDEGPDRAADLAVASDDFVVGRPLDRHDATTILAGYPWFADWGRDTMIALPGILLCTGRYDEAADTLRTFGRHTRNGLIPNRFDDYGGEPHYNTVDASLWYIHAALEYLRITGDRATWQRGPDALADVCRRIIAAYRHGTEGPIAMDADGLITAGDADTQLTWMDAKRDGVVFTPRHGKAVEINALWHRALTGCAAAFADFAPHEAEACAALAQQVKGSFNALFWDEGLGYLIDHVFPDGRADSALRPNQVFAVSLPDSPLSAARQRKVMKIVREKLLTPRGLRTLPPDDPHYHGHYGGSMFQRDAAYHQGTVWAWLIGPYVEGYLRAHGFDAAARRHARTALAGLLDELDRHSLGQIHEIYTGDPPHHPEGCPAQAWSVAETLRACLMVDL